MKPLELAPMLLLTAAMLTSCVTGTPSQPPKSACAMFSPIVPTRGEWAGLSDDLASQILAHDAVWDQLCSTHPLKP